MPRGRLLVQIGIVFPGAVLSQRLAVSECFATVLALERRAYFLVFFTPKASVSFGAVPAVLSERLVFDGWEYSAAVWTDETRVLATRFFITVSRSFPFWKTK